METESNDALKYILPYFRANKDISAIVSAISSKYDEIGSAADYLADVLTIAKARGVWLDHIGEEVGASRDEVDFANFFCVNRPHLNVEKKFYFYTSKEDPLSPLSLSDAEFMQKILAYIGENRSSATEDEVVNIIKKVTNADDVILDYTDSATVAVKLYGENLIMTRNSVTYVRQILGNGIYLEEITVNDQTT